MNLLDVKIFKRTFPNFSLTKKLSNRISNHGSMGAWEPSVTYVQIYFPFSFEIKKMFHFDLPVMIFLNHNITTQVGKLTFFYICIEYDC